MPEFQARTAGLAEANKTDVTTFNKQATGIQTLATVPMTACEGGTREKSDTRSEFLFRALEQRGRDLQSIQVGFRKRAHKCAAAGSL